MVAQLYEALGDDWLHLNVTFITVGSCSEGCGGSVGEKTEGLREGAAASYLSIMAHRGISPTSFCTPHISNSPFFCLFCASLACFVGEVGQNIATGKDLFLQERKIRVKYKGGSGSLASLTGCYFFIKF